MDRFLGTFRKGYQLLNDDDKEKSSHTIDMQPLSEMDKLHEKVKANPRIILQMLNGRRNNVPEEVQYHAVTLDYDLINYVHSKVQRHIITMYPRVIAYVRENNMELQKVALQRDLSVIELIRNPSEKVQIAVLRKDPDYLEDILNPTYNAIRYALRKDGMAIKYVDNPPLALIIVAAKQNPYSYGIVETDEETDNIVLEVVPEVIATIKNPTLQQFLDAKERLGDRIKEFADPEDRTQREIMTHNPELFTYIKNPTPESISSFTIHRKNKLL